MSTSLRSPYSWAPGRGRFGRSTIALRTRVENTITAFQATRGARGSGRNTVGQQVDWGPMSCLYTSDEGFYRFDHYEFWRNRFPAGCNLTFQPAHGSEAVLPTPGQSASDPQSDQRTGSARRGHVSSKAEQLAATTTIS
jgi:hypothetical protein